jgi:hypothetical protein
LRTPELGIWSNQRNFVCAPFLIRMSFFQATSVPPSTWAPKLSTALYMEIKTEL